MRLGYFFTLFLGWRSAFLFFIFNKFGCGYIPTEWRVRGSRVGAKTFHQEMYIQLRNYRLITSMSFEYFPI